MKGKTSLKTSSGVSEPEKKVARKKSASASKSSVEQETGSKLLSKIEEQLKKPVVKQGLRILKEILGD